jgi:hypothetical protein
MMITITTLAHISLVTLAFTIFVFTIMAMAMTTLAHTEQV